MANLGRDSRPFEILLVEDNPADARLTQEGLEWGNFLNHLTWVQDGDQAKQFLFREGEYSDAPRPDLILLDINLPKADGFSVLREIKSTEELDNIPVVMLSGSQDAEDVREAYRLHANCYIVKMSDLDGTFKLLEAIQSFWFTVAKLPTCDRAA
jgi:CheY-like chemotaxis protein